MSLSPQLRAIGPVIRILAVVIDAAGSSGWPLVLGDDDDPSTKTAFEHPLVETARLCEVGAGEGWNDDETKRTMRRWGARDQHGIYNAAGLTKAETEVAFLKFDRQLDNVEIAALLRKDAVNVGVLLFKARERLKRLAA